MFRVWFYSFWDKFGTLGAQLAIWREDVVEALRRLGGVAHLSQIYEVIREVRAEPLPRTTNAIVRRELEYNSSDAGAYQGRHDLFYSVEGIGSGVWGLRSTAQLSPKPFDFNGPSDEGRRNPKRSHTETYRVLRDTRLARALKDLNRNECQLCGESVSLKSGATYSEAHHIKPLGSPHHGPDISTNIIVLCPNHHVQCDYASISLSIGSLRIVEGHQIDQEFVDYHNELFSVVSPKNSTGVKV